MNASSSSRESHQQHQHHHPQSQTRGTKIRKLDEITINRIAAGEIVQRPSGVVKELLENSVDAGATSISIICKAGGMDMMTIQDNGCGIRRDDLEIVCERFTTSKIEKFEDLKTISTFGFRGEALASVTHVSYVTIITKTSDEKCAYKAKYFEGKLIPLKPGDDSNTNPIPCAGNNGTTIVVEDLFFNLPSRKKSFNSNDEYQRIVDVVVKYAIHFGDKKIAFSCRKVKGASPDANFPLNPSTSTIQNIQIAYGVALSRELIPVNFSSDVATESSSLQYHIEGYLSNANYSRKKSTCIIFINHRLVECSSIRKAVETVYADYLPKHTYPFVYLSILMPPQNIDVNVHPTKKEVHFLYEDLFIDQIYSRINSLLKGSNNSRIFYSQSVLVNPIAAYEIDDSKNRIVHDLQKEIVRTTALSEFTTINDNESEDTMITANDSALEPNDVVTNQIHIENPENLLIEENESSRKRPKTIAPNRLVRTDPRGQSIGKFLKKIESPTVVVPLCQVCNSDSQAIVGCQCCQTGNSKSSSPQKSQVRVFATPWKAVEFRATQKQCLREFLQQIEANCHLGVKDLFRNSVYVGVVNASYMLMQHQIQLLLVNHSFIILQMIFQVCLQRVGQFSLITLDEPISIMTFLSKCHLSSVEQNTVFQTLMQNRIYFSQNFGFNFTDAGDLCTIPEVINGYIPLQNHLLGEFLINLALNADWSSEANSYVSISYEIAKFYSSLPIIKIENGSRVSHDQMTEKGREVLESVLLPAIRSYFMPQINWEVKDYLIQIASLDKLYKIFERC